MCPRTHSPSYQLVISMSGATADHSTFQHPPQDHSPRLTAHRVALLDTRIGATRDADAVGSVPHAHLFVMTPCPQQLSNFHSARLRPRTAHRGQDVGNRVRTRAAASPFIFPAPPEQPDTFHHHHDGLNFPGLCIHAKGVTACDVTLSRTTNSGARERPPG